MFYFISSEEIRKELKRFDSFFGKKISATENLLDTKFILLSKEELKETVQWANNKIAENYNVKPEEVKSLWKSLKHDCDDFANELCVFSNMRFALMKEATASPAIFRAIVHRNPLPHAFNMCFTQQGIWYADLSRGIDTWQENPTILGFG